MRLVGMLILLFVASSLLLGQGLTWETTTTLPMAEGRTIASHSMYLPHMFKQVSENAATIFRLDKKLLVRVDYDKKQYSEVTFAELEGMVKEAEKSMDGQMAELKKQLEGMPEEQRKMMEQMMGGTMPPGGGGGKLTVTKAAGTTTINGYACTGYTVKEGEHEVAEIFATTTVPEFAAMQADLKEFGQRMAAQMSRRGPQMADAMRSVDGFPIKTTIAGITASVAKIAKASVAPSEFEVPAGFTKVPFELGPGGRRGRAGGGEH